ncbi:ATPase associated with various cellular activities AAA_3 [Planctopirus limnophila DSM 3776]|uniref:ATPase associated with various cellular activities AAA_3 n=1 Tax=Planctopirus limnophila (strain ATCC 43296 / DSM 3776 / IFAM 1008 / Mu 290) TaxID=521674 RepID=D5SVI3_PLAL2|nr:MoxR family ATPase [Planctopirus limnophila]ADG67253.1 ATPase associated with various cellular activities AAA_3 [Planctopirus limnophila DSM 3776]
MSEIQNSDDLATVHRCEQSYNKLRDELSKVIVGQGDVIEQVLVAIFARGHALLEGVPGLAKTLLVSSLAQALHLSFKRIQFTPDLMPSDVSGTDIIQENLQTREREYRFLPGPLFANMILADEINRTPPKTQAAMLEAMQERQVSAGGKVHKLPNPFFVLATQNPLEQEGTYPLPEAQLDRFLLHIRVDYPSAADEWEVARRVTSGEMGTIEPVMTAADIVEFQKLVTRVPVSDQVLGYAWALVRGSRPNSKEAREFVNKWVNWGAGPRGVITLVTCAKARAVLYGRYHATTADVQAIARGALRHRIAPNYAAQAADINSDRLIEMLLEEIPADRKYSKPAAVAV